MFTIGKVFGKKKVSIEVADKDYVFWLIENAKKNNRSRVYVSGWLSKELKKDLKEKGHRIIEFVYMSKKYTLITLVG